MTTLNTKTTPTTSPVLSYYDMAPGVTAFSTTRHGGVSRGLYASFNINPYCGDDAASVQQNRLFLCRALAVEPNRLLLPHQTHGNTVRQVTPRLLDSTAEQRAGQLEGVDALATDVPGVCIGVSTADCIPILLYDAEHHAAAAVHAGWRGTVARIAEAAVERMRQWYATCPSQLRAVIGPGISLAAFEVGDEVYQQFADAGFSMDAIATRLAPSPSLPEKWHIDLWRCNRLQLEAAGLPAANIQQAGICTYTHADQFFSARRLGVQSGRIFTGVVLR